MGGSNGGGQGGHSPLQIWGNGSSRQGTICCHPTVLGLRVFLLGGQVHGRRAPEATSRGPPHGQVAHLHVYRSLPFLRMGSDSVGGGDRKLKGWWGRGCREPPGSAFMAAKLSSFSVIVSMADICGQSGGGCGMPLSSPFS